MITWLRRNLFRTWWDSIMTVVFGYVGLWVIWTAIEFVFVTGRWEIIQVNLKLLLVGRFPDELMWLVGASLTALAFWVAAVAGGSKIDLNNVQTIPQRRELVAELGGHPIPELVEVLLGQVGLGQPGDRVDREQLGSLVLAQVEAVHVDGARTREPADRGVDRLDWFERRDERIAVFILLSGSL